MKGAMMLHVTGREKEIRDWFKATRGMHGRLDTVITDLLGLLDDQRGSLKQANGNHFEYRQQEAYLYMSPAELDKLGEDGWMLVGLIDRSEPIRYIFARPREATQTRQDAAAGGAV
jgi:hypothetical protein